MFCRTLRGTDRIRLATRPVLDGSRQIILYVGPTRTGKTRAAYEMFPDLYETPISGKGDIWFDGYQGEETVLFDEFRGALPLDALLKILDPHYVRKVPIKGSFTWFNPKRIIVTSNFHPKTWYDYTNREEHQLALRSRFNEVHLFGKVNGPRTSFIGGLIELYWPCEPRVVESKVNIINNRCVFCNYSPCDCKKPVDAEVIDVFGEDTVSPLTDV